MKDGDDNDYDATRHNLTSIHVLVSHEEHGSLPINATGAVVTDTTADHSTVGDR
jgi:hypothetical protein